MVARGEVVRSLANPANSLPAAKAWLLGYVRTDAPGYREIQVGAELYVVPSGTYRADALGTAINALVPDISWSNTSGFIGPGASGETYPDRLGWALGVVEPATAPNFDSQFVVSPIAIPLYGVTWTRVESEAERKLIFDRHRRNQGYVWGAALVWRLKLTLHRWALEALQTGWCLRGQVTVGGVDVLDTPVSVSDPTGAITGYALGLDGVRWIDSIQQTAVVEMSLVST